MMEFAERPPYIAFEARAVEDRNASIEAGHYVARDVDYVIITPAGSKDRIERVAEEWLAQIRRQSVEGKYNPVWQQHFEAAYKAWKETNTIPEDGTSVRAWPLLSPAQVATVLAANIRTVEDLAVANEDALRRLGMGGRDLKAKAVAWLESAKDAGKVASENAALKVEIESLKAQLLELSEFRRASNDKRKRAANE
jgi:hypothetical protein